MDLGSRAYQGVGHSKESRAIASIGIGASTTQTPCSSKKPQSPDLASTTLRPLASTAMALTCMADITSRRNQGLFLVGCKPEEGNQIN